MATEYERKMRIMENMEGGSLVDQKAREAKSQPAPTKNTASGMSLQKGGAADTTGANQTQQAGQGMMMTGNPYLMAAGLGLQVIGGAQAREQQREQQNINNEIGRREKVMQMMGQLGSGFGRLG